MTEIDTTLHRSTPIRPLRVMVVDDEAVIRGPLGLCLETLGHQVVEAANVEEALACASRAPLDIALVDLRLGTASGLDLMTRLLALQPRLKIIIITAYGAVDVAVRAMTRGATDFLCKPFSPEQVAVAVARASALRDLESDVGIMPDRWGTAGPEADYATTNAQLQDAILTVRRIAPTDTPVLISGETGTGKSVLARAIHGWSKNPDGPFVSIDCSARSAAYVDLSLFGDTLAGDQIVAADQPPLLVRATHGTLLIKRIDTLSPRSQARLAHVLETHSLESQERATPIRCNCRVIATTAQIDPASLTGPLWMLLDRIRVALPALRARAEDIPMLAQRYLAFARQNVQRNILGFSVESLDRLISYSWPENLRELHAVVDQAFALANSPYIEVTDLPPAVRHAVSRARPRAGDPLSLRDLEIAHIRETLAANGSLQQAADLLGLDLQALYRRRKQYGLE